MATSAPGASAAGAAAAARAAWSAGVAARCLPPSSPVAQLDRPLHSFRRDMNRQGLRECPQCMRSRPRDDDEECSHVVSCFRSVYRYTRSVWPLVVGGGDTSLEAGLVGSGSGSGGGGYHSGGSGVEEDALLGGREGGGGLLVDRSGELDWDGGLQQGFQVGPVRSVACTHTSRRLDRTDDT